MVGTGLTIPEDILRTFKNELLSTGSSKGDKTKFIIFKIADNKKEVVIDEISKDPDYEVFRNKLVSARDDQGRPAPRYAVYDVEYEIPGEGKRSKIVFISWVHKDTSLFWSTVSAGTQQALKDALGLPTTIHADEQSEIEWKVVLAVASGGKAGK